MYTATISEFKIKQDEMFRQAENYRLIKSIEKTSSPVFRFVSTVGKAIDQLLSR